MGSSGGVSSGSGYRDRDRGGHGESNSSRHMTNNSSGGHSDRSRSHRTERERRSPARRYGESAGFIDVIFFCVITRPRGIHPWYRGRSIVHQGHDS